MMCCTLAAAILATSPKQTLRGLKQFMSWKSIDRAEQLEDELLTHDQALTGLADEGHDQALTGHADLCLGGHDGTHPQPRQTHA